MVPNAFRRRSAFHPHLISAPALLAALLCGACGNDRVDGLDLGRKADRPEFSSERAWVFLGTQVSSGPRYAGHVGHARTLEWLEEQLRIRADTVVVQRFEHTSAAGERLRMANVYGRIRPELADRILLVAHWDTRRHAERSVDPADRGRPVPGANDGASGVAVVMELAELFRQQPPPIGVDILFTDGEDYGPGPEDMFLGSRHFAANLPSGPKPRYAIVLDMVGDRDARFRPEENSLRFAEEATRRIWALANVMGQDSVFSEERVGAITDDHVELAKAGIPGVLVIDYEHGPANAYWHTVDDNMRHVSRETLGVVGEVIAEHVYRGFPGQADGKSKDR